MTISNILLIRQDVYKAKTYSKDHTYTQSFLFRKAISSKRSKVKNMHNVL